MARTLSEIYAEAKEARDSYFELTEFENSSKMSVLDAFTWVTSACIWSFENLMDVFTVDLARDLQNRINGTPAYFANALLKYQHGDNLVMNEDGTSFTYASTDETKRIITKVSYTETKRDGFNDLLTIYKVAKGEAGSYERLSDEELIGARAYLSQLLFAGQQASLVSRIGDVLVPKVTVYYDGAVTEDEVFSNIEDALNDFVANVGFDGIVYAQKIIDCIQSAEHVTDVEIASGTDEQGIFVAMYDDDNKLTEMDGSVLQKVGRYFMPNSGYIKESTRSDEEADIPTWKESIVLKLEDTSVAAQ